MELTNEERLAKKLWDEIQINLANVELDFYVIMPEHIHEIINLLPHNLGANHGLSLQVKRMNERLPNIIKQYKSNVTRHVRKSLNDFEFAWQRSYHDRIIRNKKELQNIRNYIEANPLNYKKKNLNPPRGRTKSVNTIFI